MWPGWICRGARWRPADRNWKPWPVGWLMHWSIVGPTTRACGQIPRLESLSVTDAFLSWTFRRQGTSQCFPPAGDS